MMMMISSEQATATPTIVGVLVLLGPSDFGISGGVVGIKSSVSCQENTYIYLMQHVLYHGIETTLVNN